MYSETLTTLVGSGNDDIGNERTKVNDVINYIEQLIRKNRSFKQEDWMEHEHEFNTEDIAWVKTLLPFLKQKWEQEMNERLARGSPSIANQGLQKNVKKLETMMGWPLFENIETLSLLVHPFTSVAIQQPQEHSMIINAHINNPNGIVAVGRDMQITQNYGLLHQELRNFVDQVNQSKNVSTESKEELLSGVSTIEHQISLSRPNKSVITAAWNLVEKIASLEGLMQFAQRIYPLIKGFLVEQVISA